MRGKRKSHGTPGITSVLKLMFPCKKLRRSSRLEIREKSETQEKAINEGFLGYWEILPLELKFSVFTYMSVKDLSTLTITSKHMRNLVELYRSCQWSQKYLIPRPITHSVIPVAEQACYCDQFTQLGLLLKRSTCLYATRDRLQFVQQFSQNLLCHSKTTRCDNAEKCIALTCYGKFLHTVISGWDDRECAKTFDAIGQETSMMRTLSSIIKKPPASYNEREVYVRLFFRRVFLNQCSTSYDHAFWLTLILKGFPMVEQARILFLLYGPMTDGEVQWYEMVESTPVTKAQSELCFGELAKAFRVLHHYSAEWSEDDIISVLDELTSSPDDWLAENVAQLLKHCGECITLKVLNSKAINGRMTELASIITSLAMIYTREEHSVTWVVNLVKGVFRVLDSTKDQLCLIISIEDMFQDMIHELLEFADDESILDIQHLLEAKTEVAKELFTLASKNLLFMCAKTS